MNDTIKKQPLATSKNEKFYGDKKEVAWGLAISAFYPFFLIFTLYNYVLWNDAHINNNWEETNRRGKYIKWFATATIICFILQIIVTSVFLIVGAA